MDVNDQSSRNYKDKGKEFLYALCEVFDLFEYSSNDANPNNPEHAVFYKSFSQYVDKVYSTTPKQEVYQQIYLYPFILKDQLGDLGREKDRESLVEGFDDCLQETGDSVCGYAALHFPVLKGGKWPNGLKNLPYHYGEKCESAYDKILNFIYLSSEMVRFCAQNSFYFDLRKCISMPKNTDEKCSVSEDEFSDIDKNFEVLLEKFFPLKDDDSFGFNNCDRSFFFNQSFRHFFCPNWDPIEKTFKKIASLANRLDTLFDELLLRASLYGVIYTPYEKVEKACKRMPYPDSILGKLECCKKLVDAKTMSSACDLIESEKTRYFSRLRGHPRKNDKELVNVDPMLMSLVSKIPDLLKSHFVPLEEGFEAFKKSGGMLPIEINPSNVRSVVQDIFPKILSSEKSLDFAQVDTEKLNSVIRLIEDNNLMLIRKMDKHSYYGFLTYGDLLQMTNFTNPLELVMGCIDGMQTGKVRI